MTLLNKKVVRELEGLLKEFKNDITFKFFTQELECRFCSDTRQLLEEVSGLNDKLHLEIFDFVNDKDEAEQFGIQRIPALTILDKNKNDYGIRFYGIPGGYEFSSLIEAMRMVSTGDPGLKPETKDFLDKLEKEVHLQVFVTPTCPYCPGAVVLAHRLAFYCPRVTADMVEVSEFPQLAVKYNVMGVPRTVINETVFLEGAAPEHMLIDKIKAI